MVIVAGPIPEPMASARSLTALRLPTPKEQAGNMVNKVPYFYQVGVGDGNKATLCPWPPLRHAPPIGKGSAKPLRPPRLGPCKVSLSSGTLLQTKTAAECEERDSLHPRI